MGEDRIIFWLFSFPPSPFLLIKKEVKVKYSGVEVGTHRIDLFIEREIVVELKTVELKR